MRLILLLISISTVHCDIATDGTDDYVSLPLGANWEVPFGFTNTGLAYDPQDKALWIGNYTSNKLTKVDFHGTQIISEISISAQPQGIAYDTSDNTLWWADLTGEQIVHVNKNGSSAGGDITSVGFQPSGLAYESATDSLWVVNASITAKEVRRYSCADGSLLETLTLSVANVSPDGVAYDPDADRLWVSDDNAVSGSDLHVVDAGDGTVISTYTISTNAEDLTFIGDRLLYNADAEFHASISDGNRVHEFLPIDTGSLSVAVTIKLTTPSGTVAIYARGNPVSGAGWGLYRLANGNVRMFVRDGATSVTGDVAVDNNWHTLIWIVDRSADLMSLWSDGVKVSSDVDISSVSSALHHPLARVVVGASPDGDLPRYSQVTATELRVFDRVLDQSEIETLGKSRLRRVMHSRWYWSLDEGVGGSSADGDGIPDRSGQGFNGSANNGANDTGLTWQPSPILSFPE